MALENLTYMSRNYFSEANVSEYQNN